MISDCLLIRYVDGGAALTERLGQTTSLDFTMTCWGQMKRPLDATVFQAMVRVSFWARASDCSWLILRLRVNCVLIACVIETLMARDGLVMALPQVISDCS